MGWGMLPALKAERAGLTEEGKLAEQVDEPDTQNWGKAVTAACLQT